MKTIKSKVRRAKMLLSQIEKLKNYYNELDQLTVDLKKSGFKSSDGLTLIDNFNRKNTVYKAVGIKRYQLCLK